MNPVPEPAPHLKQLRYCGIPDSVEAGRSTFLSTSLRSSQVVEGHVALPEERDVAVTPSERDQNLVVLFVLAATRHFLKSGRSKGR
jgi:hypothetical protein